MATAVSTGLADLKMVGFAPEVVTAVSRPLGNTEQWALYYFETHARKCDACYAPYSVHRSGGRLCHQGHEMAQEVARYVYSLHDGQEVYSAVEGERMTRVEIPQGYECVRSLLRAMERSMLHRHGKPFVSYDKTYPIAPRQSPKDKKKEKHESPSRHSPSRRSRRTPEIVDWPEYESREPAHPLPKPLKDHHEERVGRSRKVERVDAVERTDKPRKSERADTKTLDKLDRRRSVAVAPSSDTKKGKRASSYESFDTEVRGPSSTSKSSPSRRSSRRYSSIFG